MKIAIIGANGFIGSRLVEQFHLGDQHTVIPIVRRPAGLALPARFALDWRLGDALEVGSLTKALEGCDAVVHAAIGDPLQIEKMPSILCAAAAAAGLKRVIYLSSASVHGQSIEMGTTETSALHTEHSIDYNNAKVRAERAFFLDCSKYRLDGYALRPGVVYGPRSRWIADLADELLEGRAWLYEEGAGICNSIYVDNLIHAVRLALTVTGGAGQPYLVGDAEPVTWAHFYQLAAGHLGVSAASIRAVSHLPAFEKSFRERVEKTVARPWIQSLLPAVPFKLKRATKTLIATWNPPGLPDAWTLPGGPGLRITEEMALLQQNRWRLPHQQATQILGYQAPVSFAEGIRRSFAWLHFATGVPIK